MLDLTDQADSGLGDGDPLLLHLNETTAPSDRTGHYLDAVSRGSGATPVAELVPSETIDGRGLRFDGAGCLELVAAGTTNPVATRASVGIAAIVTWDPAAQIATAGATALVLQVGDGNGLARSWKVQLEVVDAIARIARVRMSWWNSAATEELIPGAEFQVPTGPFMIIASREKTAAGFVVRLHVAGNDLGAYTHPSVDAEASVLAAPVFVAGRYNDSAAPTVVQEGLVGVVNLVHVVAREVSSEEAELAHWHLAENLPAMVLAMSQAQEQEVWPTDPASYAQREMAVDAMAFLQSRRNARRAERYFLPNVAWGWALRYWEGVLQINTRAGDGIADRRARAAERLSARFTLTGADLQEQLAEALGIANAQLVEYDDEYLDPMTVLTTSSGLYTGGHVPTAWLRCTNSNTTFTEPTGPNPYLQFDQAGTDDLSYAGWQLGGPGIESGPPFYIRFVDSGDGGRALVRGEVRALTTHPAGLAVGIVAGSLVDDEWIWLGLVDNAGNKDLVRYTFVAGALSSVTVLAAGVGAAPRWLQLEHRGTSAPGTYTAKQAASAGGLAAATPFTIVGGPTRPDWGGFSYVAAGSIVGPTSVRFGEFFSRGPDGAAHLSLTVYRDPALGGAYDLPQADALLQRIMAAHASGSVVDRRDGLNTSNANTLLDRDPLEH